MSGTIAIGLRLILLSALLATLGLRFGSLATAQSSPTLTISPTNGPPGTQVTVTGSNFPAFFPVSELTFSGIDVRPGALVTSNTGGFTANFTVPGIPSGTAIVRALVGSSTAATAFAVTGTPGAPTQPIAISLAGGSTNPTPTTVLPNQTLVIFGNGYTTKDGRDSAATLLGIASNRLPVRVEIRFITISGENIFAVAAHKVNEGRVVAVDDGGNWSAAVVIPITPTTTTAVPHELKVTDVIVDNAGVAIGAAGREGKGSLTIPPRTLTLNPATSLPGSTVAFTGTGFPAHNLMVGSEANPVVSIIYRFTVPGVGGIPLPLEVITSVSPDASGNISGSLTVPLGADTPSVNTVRAEFSLPPPNFSTVVVTTTTHTVPAPNISLSPTSGPPGILVTVTGINFKPFTSVGELFIGNIDVRPSPTPVTNSQGGFFATFTVPQLPNGGLTVTARVGGGGSTATATFTVGIPNSVSGTVTLQGRTATFPTGVGHGIATVALNPGGVSVSVGTDGSFQFTNVAAGTFTITASAAGYVSRERTGVVVGASPVTLPSVQLRCGLVDANEFVNINDITATVASFGKTLPARVDALGRFVDQNGDGFVNINDITCVVSGFGTTSPLPWP